MNLPCFALGGFAPTLVLFGWQVASGLTVGLLFGYLWYLVVHDTVHRRRVRRGSLLYELKIHHARHHHAKTPGNFGVTSSFWDRVFGTRIASDTRWSVKVPRKLCVLQ